MKNLFRLFLVLGVIFLRAKIVYADTWNLPRELNDSTLQISFEVDSTWHTVHGETSDLSAKIWMQDNKDPNSVRGEITLPVLKFNTDNDSRDERLREILLSDQYQTVKYTIHSLVGNCIPENLKEGIPCDVDIEGALTIIGKTKQIDFPSQIIKQGGDYIVMGSKEFNWLDYGIEDPSILVAKVDPNVKVKFTLTLKEK